MDYDYQEDELCPNCGCILGDDNPHPWIVFRKCEECGYSGENLLLPDLIDEAKDMRDYL